MHSIASRENMLDFLTKPSQDMLSGGRKEKMHVDNKWLCLIKKGGSRIIHTLTLADFYVIYVLSGA